MKIQHLFEKIFKKPLRSDAMEEIKEADIEKLPPVPDELPRLQRKGTIVYPSAR